MEPSPTRPADEPASDAQATRAQLLHDARRSLVPVRHAFVQQPSQAHERNAPRGALLATMVGKRQHRALLAYLWLLAVEPVLGEEPLHAAVWARSLSATTALNQDAVTTIWRQLDAHGLIERQRIRRLTWVRPRREDGQDHYTRPGAGKTDQGRAGWPRDDWYLRLPTAFWLEGWHAKLRLPGLAMLLILLQATGKNPTFEMAYEKGPAWYGLSADTVERGYADLRRHKLLDEFPQRKSAARAPEGFTQVWHRSLTGVFSTEHRQALAKAGLAEIAAKQPTAAAPDAP